MYSVEFICAIDRNLSLEDDCLGHGWGRSPVTFSTRSKVDLWPGHRQVAEAPYTIYGNLFHDDKTLPNTMSLPLSRSGSPAVWPVGPRGTAACRQPFPPLIAVTDPTHGAAWIYKTLWDPSIGAWHINPHCIYHDDGTPAFFMESYPGHEEHTGLIAHHPTARGGVHLTQHPSVAWRYAPTTIYSLLDSTPIRVVEFYSPYDRREVVRLPSYTTNTLVIQPGSPASLEFWRQRWEPGAIMEDLDTFLHPAPPPAPVLIPVKAKAEPKEPVDIPVFVRNILIADAVAKAATCPITMEPITVANAAVTSCFHLFQKEAITTWLRDHSSCPVCKQASVKICG